MRNGQSDVVTAPRIGSRSTKARPLCIERRSVALLCWQQERPDHHGQLHLPGSVAGRVRECAVHAPAVAARPTATQRRATAIALRHSRSWRRPLSLRHAGATRESLMPSGPPISYCASDDARGEVLTKWNDNARVDIVDSEWAVRRQVGGPVERRNRVRTNGV